MKDRSWNMRYALVPAAVFSLASATVSVHAAPFVDQGHGRVLLGRAAGIIRQRLFMTPRCFVAGQRVPARVTLTHAGPHASVEFSWTPTKGISTGLGLSPGAYRTDSSGVVRFSAVTPSKYGDGEIGKWVLAAEWPRAAHPFVRVYFTIVAHASDC